jgi:glycosyltransferase involved in cell wall biosynthesis
MTKPALFETMAQHDCLILPSRLDAFGMVVPEAMSVGVPAVVSDRVGAKCIIERHPRAGWIVPFETGAIREQILQLIKERQHLVMAGHAAKAAASDFSWEQYRSRVVWLLRAIHASHAK